MNEYIVIVQRHNSIRNLTAFVTSLRLSRFCILSSRSITFSLVKSCRTASVRRFCSRPLLGFLPVAATQSIICLSVSSFVFVYPNHLTIHPFGKLITCTLVTSLLSKFFHKHRLFVALSDALVHTLFYEICSRSSYAFIHFSLS